VKRTRSAAALVVDRWLCPAGRLAAAGDAARAGRSAGSDRAASPVVGVVVLVAMVLIVAATVGWAGLGFSEQLREPAPNVAESTGNLETQVGANDGIVRITHVAGESVNVENIEIVVDATSACGKRERLINLPEKGTYSGRFDDSNVESEWINNSMIDGGFNANLGVLDSRTSNTFDAGSSFEFRITGGKCQLEPGDTITVRVIHTLSESVVIEKELTAS